MSFAARLAKTRAAMEANGCDLLIVTGPVEHELAHGLRRLVPSTSINGVIVPPHGQPIWFGREQDANGAKLTA